MLAAMSARDRFIVHSPFHIPHSPFTLHITYVLLSPTFGMHQYTADLAGQMANGEGPIADGGRSAACRPDVRLITTATLPRDRYHPVVPIVTPVVTHGTGFAPEGLDLAACRRVLEAIRQQPSDIVHFTGVHLWNVPLVYALRRHKVRVVHTLHDLDPHVHVPFRRLIRLWNRLLMASGCHIVVHGRCYRQRLVARGIPAARVTYLPLLHGFLSATHPWPPPRRHRLAHTPRTRPTVLFFGRIEAYKGIETLLEAWRRLQAVPSSVPSSPPSAHTWTLCIAGPLARGVKLPPLPPGVVFHNRLILDEEADALFRSADVLVLPYRDATQSALVAAAYAYDLPVIVTRTGALPEYVIEGETGWIVPPDDPDALAAALAAALADPERLRRMGAAGRAWFEARYREARRSLLTLYQTLIASPRPISAPVGEGGGHR